MSKNIDNLLPELVKAAQNSETVDKFNSAADYLSKFNPYEDSISCDLMTDEDFLAFGDDTSNQLTPEELASVLDMDLEMFPNVLNNIEQPPKDPTPLLPEVQPLPEDPSSIEDSSSTEDLSSPSSIEDLSPSAPETPSTPLPSPPIRVPIGVKDLSLYDEFSSDMATQTDFDYLSELDELPLDGILLLQNHLAVLYEKKKEKPHPLMAQLKRKSSSGNEVVPKKKNIKFQCKICLQFITIHRSSVYRHIEILHPTEESSMINVNKLK